MRLLISDHAIERYIERCAPALRYSEARDRLRERLHEAVRLNARTYRGQDRWHLHSDPPCILVTRPAREGGDHQVVTVLPMEELNADNDPEVLAELMAEMSARITTLEKQPKRERSENIYPLQLELAGIKEQMKTARMELRLREIEHKTLRHQANRDEQMNRLRRLARIAIRGVMTGDIEAAREELREEAGEAGKGLLNPGFYLKR